MLLNILNGLEIIWQKRNHLPDLFYIPGNEQWLGQMECLQSRLIICGSNDKSLLAPIHANFKKTDVLIIETIQIH